jgi:hypothetical protein
MANQTTVQLKRSSVTGKVPDSANIEIGEPVVNLADKIIFTKDGAGTVIVVGAGTTSNVIEGNNLYFSNARVSSAISTQTLSNATFSSSLKANELFSTQSAGDEGGQLYLAKAATNTTLAGDVAIDIFQNKLRIFEGGGSARGVYIDLSAAGDGVSTNLIGGGSGTITSVAGITSGAVSNVQLATAAVYSQTLTNATFSANVTADIFISNNNGNGENYKIGDDIWIGDTNLANTLRVKGQQDATQGYITLGSNDGNTLGRSGAGALTYTAGFAAANVVATGNISAGNATVTNALTAGNFQTTRTNSADDGTGQIFLNGSNGNRIDWNTEGVGAPTFTTRSVGTKLTLYPTLGASAVDYAIGINSGAFWSSIPGNDAGQFFRWYGGTTEVANLSGTGHFTTVGNVKATVYNDSSDRRLLIKDANGIIVWGG